MRSGDAGVGTADERVPLWSFHGASNVLSSFVPMQHTRDVKTASKNSIYHVQE